MAELYSKVVTTKKLEELGIKLPKQPLNSWQLWARHHREQRYGVIDWAQLPPAEQQHWREQNQAQRNAYQHAKEDILRAALPQLRAARWLCKPRTRHALFVQQVWAEPSLRGDLNGARCKDVCTVSAAAFGGLTAAEKSEYSQAAASDKALHEGYRQRVLALFPEALSVADVRFTPEAAQLVLGDAECRGLIERMEQVVSTLPPLRPQTILAVQRSLRPVQAEARQATAQAAAPAAAAAQEVGAAAAAHQAGGVELELLRRVVPNRPESFYQLLLAGGAAAPANLRRGRKCGAAAVVGAVAGGGGGSNMPAPRKRARVVEAHLGAEGRQEGQWGQGERLQVAERPEGGQETVRDVPQQLGRRPRRQVGPGPARGGSAHAAPKSPTAHAASLPESPELGGCMDAEPQPVEPRLASCAEAAPPKEACRPGPLPRVLVSFPRLLKMLYTPPSHAATEAPPGSAAPPAGPTASRPAQVAGAAAPAPRQLPDARPQPQPRPCQGALRAARTPGSTPPKPAQGATPRRLLGKGSARAKKRAAAQPAASCVSSLWGHSHHRSSGGGMASPTPSYATAAAVEALQMMAETRGGGAALDQEEQAVQGPSAQMQRQAAQAAPLPPLPQSDEAHLQEPQQQPQHQQQQEEEQEVPLLPRQTQRQGMQPAAAAAAAASIVDLTGEDEGPQGLLPMEIEEDSWCRCVGESAADGTTEPRPTYSQLLALLGRSQHSVPADGNCQMHAICFDRLLREGVPLEAIAQKVLAARAAELRRGIGQRLREDPVLHQLAGGAAEARRVAERVEGMARSGGDVRRWGGGLSARAAALALGADIFIINTHRPFLSLNWYPGTSTLVPGSDSLPFPSGRDDRGYPPKLFHPDSILLAYDGLCHFDGISPPPPDPSRPAEEWVRAAQVAGIPVDPDPCREQTVAGMARRGEAKRARILWPQQVQQQQGEVEGEAQQPQRDALPPLPPPPLQEQFQGAAVGQQHAQPAPHPEQPAEPVTASPTGSGAGQAGDAHVQPLQQQSPAPCLSSGGSAVAGGPEQSFGMLPAYQLPPLSLLLRGAEIGWEGSDDSILCELERSQGDCGSSQAADGEEEEEKEEGEEEELSSEEEGGEGGADTWYEEAGVSLELYSFWQAVLRQQEALLQRGQEALLQQGAMLQRNQEVGMEEGGGVQQGGAAAEHGGEGSAAADGNLVQQFRRGEAQCQSGAAGEPGCEVAEQGALCSQHCQLVAEPPHPPAAQHQQPPLHGQPAWASCPASRDAPHGTWGAPPSVHATGAGGQHCSAQGSHSDLATPKQAGEQGCAGGSVSLGPDDPASHSENDSKEQPQQQQQAGGIGSSSAFGGFAVLLAKPPTAAAGSSAQCIPARPASSPAPPSAAVAEAAEGKAGDAAGGPASLAPGEATCQSDSNSEQQQQQQQQQGASAGSMFGVSAGPPAHPAEPAAPALPGAGPAPASVPNAAAAQPGGEAALVTGAAVAAAATGAEVAPSACAGPSLTLPGRSPRAPEEQAPLRSLPAASAAPASAGGPPASAARPAQQPAGAAACSQQGEQLPSPSHSAAGAQPAGPELATTPQAAVWSPVRHPYRWANLCLPSPPTPCGLQSPQTQSPCLPCGGQVGPSHGETAMAAQVASPPAETQPAVEMPDMPSLHPEAAGGALAAQGAPSPMAAAAGAASLEPEPPGSPSEPCSPGALPAAALAPCLHAAPAGCSEPRSPQALPAPALMLDIPALLQAAAAEPYPHAAAPPTGPPHAVSPLLNTTLPLPLPQPACALEAAAVEGQPAGAAAAQPHAAAIEDQALAPAGPVRHAEGTYMVIRAAPADTLNSSWAQEPGPSSLGGPSPPLGGYLNMLRRAGLAPPEARADRPQAAAMQSPHCRKQVPQGCIAASAAASGAVPPMGTGAWVEEAFQGVGAASPACLQCMPQQLPSSFLAMLGEGFPRLPDPSQQAAAAATAGEHMRWLEQHQQHQQHQRQQSVQEPQQQGREPLTRKPRAAPRANTPSGVDGVVAGAPFAQQEGACSKPAKPAPRGRKAGKAGLGSRSRPACLNPSKTATGTGAQGSQPPIDLDFPVGAVPVGADPTGAGLWQQWPAGAALHAQPQQGMVSVGDLHAAPAAAARWPAAAAPAAAGQAQGGAAAGPGPCAAGGARAAVATAAAAAATLAQQIRVHGAAALSAIQAAKHAEADLWLAEDRHVEALLGCMASEAAPGPEEASPAAETARVALEVARHRYKLLLQQVQFAVAQTEQLKARYQAWLQAGAAAVGGVVAGAAPGGGE